LFFALEFCQRRPKVIPAPIRIQPTLVPICLTPHIHTLRWLRYSLSAGCSVAKLLPPHLQPVFSLRQQTCLPAHLRNPSQRSPPQQLHDESMCSKSPKTSIASALSVKTCSLLRPHPCVWPVFDISDIGQFTVRGSCSVDSNTRRPSVSVIVFTAACTTPAKSCAKPLVPETETRGTFTG
jgi:hypothetical protein